MKKKSLSKNKQPKLKEVTYKTLPTQAVDELCLHDTSKQDLEKIMLVNDLGCKLKKLKSFFCEQAQMVGDAHCANVEVRVYFTIKEKES